MGMVSTSSGYGISGSYTNLSGNTVSYDQYSNKPLLVDAMKTTCSYCQDQQPILVQLEQTHGEYIDILSISIYTGDTIQSMQSFVNEYGHAGDAGLDQQFGSEYNIEGTPTMILFDGLGNEIHRWPGYTPLAELQYDINNILGITASEAQPTSENSVERSGNEVTSVVERFFSNQLVQLGIVTAVLIMIYAKSTSSGGNVGKTNGKEKLSKIEEYRRQQKARQNK